MHGGIAMDGEPDHRLPSLARSLLVGAPCQVTDCHLPPLTLSDCGLSRPSDSLLHAKRHLGTGIACPELRAPSLPSDLVDSDGTSFGPGELVSYEAGTHHNSWTEGGCLIAVFEWQRP